MHLVVVPLSVWLLVAAIRVGRGFVAQAIDAQATVRWSRARWAALSRDTVAHVAFRLGAPLGWGGDDRPDPPGPRGVLLVQDPRVPRVSMALVEAFLRNRGFDVWLPPRPSDGTLAEQAERLDGEIRRWLEGSDTSEVDVVAFGAGGVAAAWMVAHVDASRVRTLVTLGAPWHGTRTAVFRGGPCAADLAPGASALDRLLPARTAVVSLWCPEDPEVVPPTSAIAYPPEAVAVDGAGHLGLLVSSRALRAVAAALGAPAPGPTGSATP